MKHIRTNQMMRITATVIFAVMFLVVSASADDEVPTFKMGHCPGIRISA